jgi:hypothetical protein
MFHFFFLVLEEKLSLRMLRERHEGYIVCMSCRITLVFLPVLLHLFSGVCINHTSLLSDRNRRRGVRSITSLVQTTHHEDSLIHTDLHDLLHRTILLIY